MKSAMPVAALREVLDHRPLESLRPMTLPQLAPVRRDVEHFRAEPDPPEQAREPVPRCVDMVQAPAVADEQTTVGDRLDDVGDAAADRHRVAVEIESGPALHAALGQDDDQGLLVMQPLQHLRPRLVALARHPHHVPRHEPEEPADDRPRQRLVGHWNHAVRRDPPEQAIGRYGRQHRLEQAGVIEERHHPQAGPRIIDFANELETNPEQEPARGLDREQQEKDGTTPHRRSVC